VFAVGGALLIVIVVIAIVLAVGGGGGARQTATVKGRTVDQLVLAPAGSGSGNRRAAGAGAVLSQAGTMLLLLQAHGLSPNHGNSYAVWLFNTPGDSRLLGFVSPPVGRSGKFSSGTTLPDDAVRFHSVIVTRELGRSPIAPGPVVLRAPLSLS
jgi:hypothetical protein